MDREMKVMWRKLNAVSDAFENCVDLDDRDVLYNECAKINKARERDMLNNFKILSSATPPKKLLKIRTPVTNAFDKLRATRVARLPATMFSRRVPKDQL